LDYFDLLATGACWLVDPGSSFFDLLSLDKSSSVLLSSLAVWLELLLFLHDCHIMATVVFLAAGGGEELLFRVVVKRVLMML